jgi:hypothetical protein
VVGISPPAPFGGEVVLGVDLGEWISVPSHLLFCFSACRYCLCGSENWGSYTVSIVENIKILKSSCRTEKLRAVFLKCNPINMLIKEFKL